MGNNSRMNIQGYVSMLNCTHDGSLKLNPNIERLRFVPFTVTVPVATVVIPLCCKIHQCLLLRNQLASCDPLTTFVASLSIFLNFLKAISYFSAIFSAILCCMLAQ
jgi:hypothetical protein